MAKKELNYLGLDIKKTNEIIKKLNKLLSNYQVFTINVKGYHWNIKGEGFFTIHKKLDEIYSDLSEKSDEIAERIVTLGGVPYHSYSEYLKHSSVKEDTNIKDIRIVLKNLLLTYGKILIVLRELLALADESNDTGTSDLISGFITEQEKLMWMLKASI